MVDDGVFAKVKGIPDLRRELERLPAKLRKRALLNALRAGGRVVRDNARRLAPVLALPVRRKSGAAVRTPGTLRKAISVRTSKRANRAGDVGVFINVKPLPGAKYKTRTTKGLLGGKRRERVLVKASQRGANNPKDPYYWKFQEFGTKFMSGRKFLTRAAARLPAALGVITAKLGPAVQRILDKQANQ